MSINRERKRFYRVWHKMIERCYYKDDPQYKNYGARGIAVCAKWRNSFDAFLLDMGPRPSQQHTIDRINNNGPYSPSNCRWATRTEQVLNSRTTRVLEFAGKRMSLLRWAHAIGISNTALKARLKKWPVPVALTMPRHQGQRP